MSFQLALEGSTVRLSGTVTNTTVPALLEQLAGLSPSQLDLSLVEVVDSAAVSLLLNLKRRHGANLTVSHTPDNLRSLIHLYGLDELLANGS